MNDFNGRNQEIDLVDFSSSGEMARIREQERIEKEKREKQALRIRRAEMIRRKKMQRLKQTVVAWSIVALVLMAFIAAVIGIVSLFSKDEEPLPPAEGDKVSLEQTNLVSDFEKAEATVYSKDGNVENEILSVLERVSADMSNSVPEALNGTVHGSELSLIVDAYAWNDTFYDRERIKQLVRDFPLYSNGYVWSSEHKMASPLTGSYLYDTNAAFISAVCEICEWESSGDFLDEADMTAEDKGDVSNTMTVGEKLDAATAHFFDTSDYLNGGGVRYNEEDGLVYVRTTENNGTVKGKPSNLFFGYRFGYVDTYINLTFNKAMQDLEKLYILLGDKEKAELYASYAEKNSNAINKKLYNEKLGRYVACIDDTGEIHDNGFTVINLMAVSFGVADKEQSKKILSWIDGTSNVKSDSLQGKAILKNGILPVFSTAMESGTMWFLNNEYPLSGKADFGKFWLNGAPSALSGNYYFLSAKSEGNKKLIARAEKVLLSFADKSFENTLRDNGEPELYSDLLVSNAMKKMLGITADKKMLTVNPAFAENDCFGIKNIAFSENSYGFLFGGNDTYVIADKNMAVKLKIGGFSSLANVKMTVVEGDEIVLTKELTAGADGMLQVSQKFGADTYIKLEETVIEE